MKVLVACEFSGILREAFKSKGHDAWSCDLEDTILPGQHIRGNVLDVLADDWDMMIAHPPCTFLSYAGIQHWNTPGREEKREEAMSFFYSLFNANIKHICVENPVGWPNTVFKKPSQIIHPYYFGDTIMKKTCLWLKNLPLLTYKKTGPPEPIYINSKGKNIHWTDGVRGNGLLNRQQVRSVLSVFIANAMAEQWGNGIKNYQMEMF